MNKPVNPKTDSDTLSNNTADTKNLCVPIEVYSRVSGYYRPLRQWNKGKQEEFRERKSMVF